MDFSFAKIHDELVRALCSTLIHSLWQGLLLAAFAGVIILFTRKSSPVTRYNLLIGGLIIFCCTTTFTLFYQITKENDLKINTMLGQQTTTTASMPLLPIVKAEVSDGQFIGFLTGHANTIVLIWFLIVFARLIQLLTGLRSLHELRRKATFTLGEDLQNKVATLAASMGIKQWVGIAESAMVKVPMVIGHLKPLILIPVGLLIALPPSAIEAILVHELAHIRRRDYLVNVMVSLMEVVFFFNPAVLWLASLIRAEREYCCDDMVVAQTSSETNYIKALIACQEYKLSIPAYAMPLNGHKNQLLGRVRRMLSKNNQSLNVVEKSLLTLCLVVAGLLTLAFSNVEKINHASQEVIKISRDLISKTETKEQKEVKAVNFPKIVELKAPVVDTTKCEIYLPSEVDEQTSVLLTNGDFQTRLLKQNGILYQINKLGLRIGSLQVNGHTVPVAQHQKYTAIIDSLQYKKRNLPKLTVAKDRLDYFDAKQKYRTDSDRNYSKDYGTHKTGYEVQLPETPSKSDGPVNMKISSTTDMSGQLVEAILNDSLVSNVRSYKLTESELIVNGKRIPDQAFRSFKDKYIESIQKGSTVYYNYDTRTVIN